jgi:uncharacterized membrane protein YadS
MPNPGSNSTGSRGFDLLHLNAMMLSFLLGIALGNLLPRQAWAAQGVASSAMILKAGVVIMGSLYSFAEIGKIGKTSLLMIFFFVFATFGFVIWLGKLLRTPRPLTGVLACGCGICGVSAEIAAAPLMGATAAELAYCIGVTLGFGLLEVLSLPCHWNLAGAIQQPIRRMGRHRYLEFSPSSGSGFGLRKESGNSGHRQDC